MAVRRASLATCDRGPSDAGVRGDAALLVRDGAVAWIGPDAEAAARFDLSSTLQVDAGGRLVTPGLVDFHTHLVFGDRGEREAEFAELAAGTPYAAIARRGGGILATARATRAASDEELLWGAVARARRLLAQGVTTVEVKSGYGLSVDEELRMLRVVRELARALAGEMTVVPTVLALHAVPPERGGDREGWVREVVERLLPAVAEGRLAAFCDAFVASTAFGLEDARRVLEAGRALGLVPRLHADQLADDGAAALAAEVGAASADHLEHVSEAGIAALARGGVVAGLLPTSTLVARARPWAPGRRLVDAGVTVALATNVNPGTAMSENAALGLSLACLENGLTPDEALVAATAGGARALRLGDVGRLAPGMAADLVLWGARTPAHLAWHVGVGHALLVVKGGRIVHQAEAWAAADCK
ncbi:MAG TPA: imidazolonepropionase [Anaeromyxobacteraceae bacterium]|nr:imidazolonepropionase [Anaeromyxobacteraceae bacterium]